MALQLLIHKLKIQEEMILRLFLVEGLDNLKMEARQVLFLNGKNYGRSITPQKQTNSKKKRSHLWLSAVGTGGGEPEEGSQKVLTCTHKISTKAVMGLPGAPAVKNPPVNAGHAGLIPKSGRSPGGGKDNPLQYCCLGKPMDRGVWWATVHGVTKSD